MASRSDKQIALIPILVLPVLAWIITAKKIEPYLGVIELFKITPERPILWLPIIGGLLLGILFAWFLLHNEYGEFKGAPFKKFLRGTQIVKPIRLKQKTKEKNKKQITISNIPMPTKAENLHTLINGSTGMGKSVAMREIAYTGLLRGDRMVFADPDGAMLNIFGRNQKDKILNPFDGRTEGWSVFNEIRNTYDFTRLANAIIPKGKTADAEEWAGYSRLLLSETMKKLQLLGSATTQELFRWTTIVPVDDLKDFLEGTAAESLFAGTSEGSKALGSARFLISDKLAPHLHMPEGNFSIRDFLEDETAGNLYMTYREDMRSALRPLLSAWTDIISSTIVSFPEDENRIIWINLDELASLDKQYTLKDLLTKGRKRGARVVAGLQSTAQLDDIYGEEQAQELRSCFSSLIVLGGAKADPKTAEDMSLSLGEHEVLREKETTTSNGTTTSTDVVRERVISPAEITNTPELTAFIAFAGGLPIARVKMKYTHFKKHMPGFVDRDGVIC